MLNEPKKILNSEQTALVAELSATYGIDPEEIMFFDDSVKPFLTYEATGAMSNKLIDLQHIGVEPIASPIADAIAVKCTIVTADGHSRSAVGVANLAEQVSGTQISNQQAMNLASARALRNVLKSAGIDLMKLHHNQADVLDFKPQSSFTGHLGQLHILGKEKGVIVGEDKTVWYHLLWSRYGKQHSNELTEVEAADFVAYLKAYVPMPKAA